MQRLQRFGEPELRTVERAREMAQELIKGFYVLAPREWERVHYEVCTLDRLEPEEICDQAFAQVLCYDHIKQIGSRIIEHHDLYRICLQDHRILRVAQRSGAGDKLGKLELEPMLLYILTHELVHIVHFSQHMQHVNLDPALRQQEELSVEQATRNILAPVKNPALNQVIRTFAEC